MIINNVIYIQDLSKDAKAKIERKDGRMIINKADIGEQICTLDESNIIENYNEKGENAFIGANVYSYNKIKSQSVVIVESNSEYYFFRILDIAPDADFNALINAYSIDKGNPIASVSVIQDKYFTQVITDLDGNKHDTRTFEFFEVKQINEAAAIEQIIKILISAKPVTDDKSNRIYNQIHQIDGDTDKTMEEKGVYLLKFILSDNSEFELYVCRHSNYIQINSSSFFELSENDIKSLINVAKK